MTRAPDFDRLRDTLLRRGPTDGVPLFELGLHPTHMDVARAHFAGLPPLTEAQWSDPATRPQAVVEFWKCAGYDYVRPALPLGFTNLSTTAIADTGGEGDREWAPEHGGDIIDRESFEAYDWPTLENLDFSELRHCSDHLPDGMGIVLAVGGGFLEWAMGLLGFEGYCMMLFQDPELVRDVHTRIGEHILAAVEAAFGHGRIDAVMIGDDMGFRTSTMVAPETLREHVIPWHARLVDLVHSHGALFVLHSCGWLELIMDDLIDTVKIDGKHSYENNITPVWEAKRRWGDRVAILGGVDMDILTRSSVDECRAAVRDVLARCAPGGGYALGSGNTVANYLPSANYLAMVEEGLAWRNP
jgi:uroporphyrinogen decarboxylase